MVNGVDVAEWSAYSTLDGNSSWYDFNKDGLTNGFDLSILQFFLGNTCAH